MARRKTIADYPCADISVRRNTWIYQMVDRILREPEVIRITARCHSSIYNGMKDGTFPKCVKIGARAVGWRESDIQKWIAEREAA